MIGSSLRMLGVAVAAFVLAASPAAHAQDGCIADLDGDGVVNGNDLATVLVGWGACVGCAGDVNGNGVVNGEDLAAVLVRWGATCAPTVTGVYPAVGTPEGGTAITVYGSGFQTATAVLLNGVPCTKVAVLSSSVIQATTPPGMPGLATLSVVLASSAVDTTYRFSYPVPWATVLEYDPDPIVVTNPFIRYSISQTGYPWRVRENVTQIEMLLIPPGAFKRGCSPSLQYGCDTDEYGGLVVLTSAFYMGRYEVTQAEWTTTIVDNPSLFGPLSGYVDTASRPVERVSWNLAQSWLWANNGLRFPTEAEWEYAYRAWTTSAFHGAPGFPSGTDDDALVGAIAWFEGNKGTVGTPGWGTKIVGQKAANGFGLHDMSGNVWEWVNDWYSTDYHLAAPLEDPPGPKTGMYRVLRGGSWEHGTNELRSSRRFMHSPDYAGDSFGFRVARNP